MISPVAGSKRQYCLLHKREGLAVDIEGLAGRGLDLLSVDDTSLNQEAWII